jgi:DNA polymerase III delta prime subunit
MVSSYQPRLVDGLLARRVRHHAAILLVGPRATGKTTTAIRLANSIMRLDERGQSAATEADPDAALRGLKGPVGSSSPGLCGVTSTHQPGQELAGSFGSP